MNSCIRNAANTVVYTSTHDNPTTRGWFEELNVEEIEAWIARWTGGGTAVIAVDAPIIIRNRSSIRPAERALNQQFSRFHAGCHPTNLSRPFASYILRFSSRLRSAGFAFNLETTAQEQGRYQIEVHPHAASVNLFRLPRIITSRAT